MNKSYKQLVANTGIFAAAKMGAKIVVLLLLPLYTNVLTTTEFGTTELILTYANFIVPILSLSIQEAVFRFGLDVNSDKNGIITNAVLITLLLSLFSFFILPPIAGMLEIGDYSYCFSWLIISMMFRQIFNLFLKGCNKNSLFALDTVIYSLSLGLFNILFLIVLDLRVNGYVYALLFANIISIFFCLYTGNICSYIVIKSADKKLLIQMMKYSVPLILNQISWWISNSSDRFILSRIDSVASVGIYSAAAKIPAIISNFISVFIQALVISAISEYKKEDGKIFFENTFQAFHFGLVGCTYVFLLFLRFVVKLLIGVDFSSAYYYIPTLLLASNYLGYAYFWGVLYTAEKRNVSAMISTLIAAVVNIVLDIVMIKLWGIQGACIATCISHLVLAGYRIVNTQNILTFCWKPIKTLVSNSFLIIACVALTNDFYGVTIVAITFFIQLIMYRDSIIYIRKKLLRITRSS